LIRQGAGKVNGLFGATLDRLLPLGLENQAYGAGLLGSIFADLRPLQYRPSDRRYTELMDAVLGIFDKDKAEGIPFKTRLAAADALGQAGDPRLAKDNRVTIPAGTFYMGAQKNGQNADPEAEVDENPVRRIALPAFRIGRYPVTVQEFSAFIAAGGYRQPQHWAKEWKGEFTEPDDWEKQQAYPSRPVVGVSWYEALAYCSWVGGRLPTEAEWERAPRGPEGKRPPLDPSIANYGFRPGHPTPVGLYPKGSTSEGLCDMLGNVWEWCDNWYGPYEAGALQNEYKVVRGGSWNFNPQLVRVSVRLWNEPASQIHSIGFRCAGNQTERLGI